MTDSPTDRSNVPVDPSLFHAIKARGPSWSRYRVTSEVAQGGMGVILRVWDEDLRRHLAMKVLLDEHENSASRLSRFLEEAQITGQLDHPGIVPVHELGIDGQGRVFFTMKLVKGMTLAQVFDAVKSGADGWNPTRALSVVLRVCEAMAFAHEKGVVHRDLKPANIMVGRFGETYVMDWGLARVLGQRDTKDIRPRPNESVVRTERRDVTPDSSLLTMDGDQVGTPAYMPPEQAQGDLERIGPHSDVYAVGAILYHLLSGQPPYIEPGTKPTPWAILAQVLTAPPKSLHTLAKDVPAELLAICDKAMERDIGRRYQKMSGLADDLRAYLERRVVKAYETGALAEMKKWVQRNKGLAAAAAALIAVLAGATFVVGHKNRAIAARTAEFDQLAGVVHLDSARANEALLYPAWPDKLAGMRRWLAEDVAKLIAMKPTIIATIADLDARSAAGSFADESQRFLHTTLTKLRSDLDAFEAGSVASVHRRLAWASQIESLTLRHPRARVTWDEARAAIAAADGIVASTLYREAPVDLKPQMGLVPLGMNPLTKLWEFYELRSACDVMAGHDAATLEIPVRRADGWIETEDGTGIVFVLIPGGTYLQGAQKSGATAPNFDPLATADETPQSVTLAPYFLAQHELTNGQWYRLTGGDEPSWFRRGVIYDDDPSPIGWTHPVDFVSWDDCALRLPQFGFSLPTEAQWERGARGGTSTPYWTGIDAPSLAGAANIVDRRADRAWPALGEQVVDFDDGYVSKAAVGAFAANPFGLFDVHGNVWEWCADVYSEVGVAPRAGDGLRIPAAQDIVSRVNRGGSFYYAAALARCSARRNVAASYRTGNLGVRPARAMH